MSDENGIDWGKVLIAGLGIAGGVYGGYKVRSAYQQYKAGGSKGTVRDVDSMAARVVREARRLCTPTPPLDFVATGDPRWDDELMGGKLGDRAWKRYDSHLNETGGFRYGTTCAVVCSGVLEAAGVSSWVSPLTHASGKLLLNLPEPVGVGQTNGAWAVRFASGGDACGIKRPGSDVDKFNPGALYYLQRGNPANWHVGILLERTGNDLLTADGGQNCLIGGEKEQCARISKRTLNGRVMSSSVPGGESGELAWFLDFSLSGG